MPCSDGGPCYSTRNVITTETKLSSYEEMLCSACRVLQRLKFDFDENPELSKWWDKHKRQDQKRQAEEAKIAREIEACVVLLDKPLSKLTSAEKSLLQKHGYL